MKNKHVLIAAFSVCSAMLFSCTKEPLNNLTQEESRIYVTNSDSTLNFGSYKTYSISDSADVLDNGQTYKDLQPVDQAYMDAIKKYMDDRGYTLVSKNSNPDLVLNVNRIYNTSTGLYDYNDYWDYYGGYWDPYEWGYGGYDYYVPYSYGVYQITEGAVSIDMLDLKNANAKGKIEVIWNGLIRGEGIFNSSTADASVKALFDQSTYLQSN
ncbi:MAG TPA: DUF4136 domain-containing protein [Parafilimonas sp.]|nr:DUF4136 domain-containing protein [Parafilimonas sp.]